MAFIDSYRRNCRTCGQRIIMGEINPGHWRAFDIPVAGTRIWIYHQH